MPTATDRPLTFQPSRPKLLLLELWGLGDLTFSTPVLRAAVERYDVTLVGKAHARPLLEATFPDVHFIAYDAPWTAYRDKYRLWKWRWSEMLDLVRQLRREHFHLAISVRNDPRDHLFMWMIGADERFGFPLRGSAVFLTHPLTRSRPKQHKVRDWRDIGQALGFPDMENADPRIDHAHYRSDRVDELFRGITKPVVCLHPGARIVVRRWPEENFATVVARMRELFDFHLALIPDLDGYGLGLAPIVDSVLPALSVAELVDVLGRADLLLCNDSGPGHIAASCGRPTIVVFGPTDPDWFSPWGEIHHLVIRDICPWRPCFDYCKFREPFCLTKLEPDRMWPEIREHIERLMEDGILPQEFGHPSTLTSA